TARSPQSPKVFSDHDSNVQAAHNEKGDVDTAFKQADAVHEASYSVPARLHVCLETHGVTVQWLGADRLKVWASTQDITGVRNDFANAYHLPADNVEVICEVMGGGFGSKFGMGVEGRAAGDLARQAKAPVRLLLTRKEEFLAVGNAPSAAARVKIAATKDGKMTAFQAVGYGTGGVGDVGISLPYVYDIPAYRVNYDTVFTNAGGSRSFRAPNHPQSSFLMELAVDELAAKLAMDPLELRRKNDSSPVRMKEYTIGADRIGWSRRNRVPGQAPGPIKRGMGMAASSWYGGGNPGTTARVTINQDGSVLVVAGTQDLGTGTRTYAGATVADELQLRSRPASSGGGAIPEPEVVGA
ncbi:MAG: molybdopterin-dependent oxidoreductase, partial [Chloroflexi bacterium]|nr:molybdopterin-dependent oxidoreductase [Chloroflexota bacterium]